MKTPLFSRSRIFQALATAALLTATLSSSALAERRATEDALNLEMFAAMDAGQVEVKIIPQDATKANVIIKNLTDKPVHLQLPEAFASVPVLAQGFGGGGGIGGGGGGGIGGGGGGQQSGGGGFGGGGGGIGGGGGQGGGGFGGGGGGVFRVAPEKSRKLAVKTVCLEHGKPDPNPKIPYKIVPLDQFTTNSDVRVLCESLGYNQVSQNAAQAVAWHLMDGLSWQELAAKNRVESKYTGNQAWFSVAELRSAQAITSRVAQVARDRANSEDSESSTGSSSMSSEDSDTYQSEG